MYQKFDKDEKWLYYHYIELDKSQDEIGSENNLSGSTVSRWLKKFGIKKENIIPKRKPVERNKTYQNKDWLINEYSILGKPLTQIAKEENVRKSAIGYWKKYFSIPTNSYKGIKSKSSWKGGTYINNDGYLKIHKPNHHRADKSGYTYKHILVTEKKYGIPIKKGWVIHHIDGDRLNNNPENLILCKDYKKHRYMHQQLKQISFEAIQKGIILFNENTKKYYINPEMRGGI